MATAALYGSVGNHSDVCFILIFQRKYFDLLVIRILGWAAGRSLCAVRHRQAFVPTLFNRTNESG